MITIEGVEGVGKTTLIERLVPWLQQRGHTARALREPGGTALGETLRELLKNGDIRMSPVSELLLFEAARGELVRQVIAPALERGEIIVLDRFFDSTTAYQGYGRGLELDTVLRLHRLVCGEVFPHTTLLLDLDPQLGLARVQRDARRDEDARQRDRFEREAIDFLMRVRDGFLALANNEPGRFVVIPGNAGPETVWSTVETALISRGF